MVCGSRIFLTIIWNDVPRKSSMCSHFLLCATMSNYTYVLIHNRGVGKKSSRPKTEPENPESEPEETDISVLGSLLGF